MEDIIYTQEEILKNIEVFRKKEDELIGQRKDLNKAIHHTKKQREHWELLDISQLKLI
jgi:hypothetical protein